ncbi:MAG TPA: single-stranded DNA-binding protein [Candidatus Limnocylindria bacterium]|nr:single-stranded DNA-binding protein [Candidatus Limnocylindria bacterium]
MSLNKAMIIGNLGRDPEMRYTPNGQSVTQFTVAVNRNFRGSDGEWQEETEWFRVVAWGPTGERAAENLRKGVKVYVEGRLQTRNWEDQSGNKRYTTELVADRVVSLERRPRADEGDPGFTPPAGRRPVEAAAGSGPAGSASAGPAPAGAPAGRGGDELDQADLDDLPF